MGVRLISGEENASKAIAFVLAVELYLQVIVRVGVVACSYTAVGRLSDISKSSFFCAVCMSVTSLSSSISHSSSIICAISTG